MALEIKGLAELRARLERVDVEDAARRAQAEQAERLAAAVRDRLSTPPGAGEHDLPWLQTGGLRESIAVTTDELDAVVGTSHPAAVPLELGTQHMPARPFLVPTAIGLGEMIALAIGEAVAHAIKGEDPPAPTTPTSTPPAEGTRAVPANPAHGPGSATTSGALPPEDGKDQPNASNSAKSGNFNLPDDRLSYILDGDGKGGGGHGPGRNTPGKSSFPSDWSDDQTKDAIMDVANDPQSTRNTQTQSGRTTIEGTRGGIDILVVIGGDGRTIINAYPTNVPRNP